MLSLYSTPSHVEVRTRVTRWIYDLKIGSVERFTRNKTGYPDRGSLMLHLVLTIRECFLCLVLASRAPVAPSQSPSRGYQRRMQSHIAPSSSSVSRRTILLWNRSACAATRILGQINWNVQTVLPRSLFESAACLRRFYRSN